MPIATTCPSCQALFRLPDEMAGRRVKCQKCANLFEVPRGNAETTTPGVAVVIEAQPIAEPAQPVAATSLSLPPLPPLPIDPPAPGAESGCEDRDDDDDRYRNGKTKPPPLRRRGGRRSLVAARAVTRSPSRARRSSASRCRRGSFRPVLHRLRGRLGRHLGHGWSRTGENAGAAACCQRHPSSTICRQGRQ